MSQSKRITECQISGSKDLKSFLFLGFVPPVNQMVDIGTPIAEQTMYPLELLFCPESALVQISYDVDQTILFAPEYPYTSGTTRILVDNFKDLAAKVAGRPDIRPGSFVIDIGSNDGTLLKPFKELGYKVLGIEPSDKAQLAQQNGIDTIQTYFSAKTAAQVASQKGKAQVITAANVFAHITDIHDVVRGIKNLMNDDSIFISENHYLLDLLTTLQYDTVYHEHLRYYSLHSLKKLFDQHDLEIFKVERIPTHGGSVRVYTCFKGKKEIEKSVKDLFAEEERAGLTHFETYQSFSEKVMTSKLQLMGLLSQLKTDPSTRIVGIGAPSRASTLISYTGLDSQTVEAVMEIKGSHKIGKYMPGTTIPVLDEEYLYRTQPDYALLFSWHIGDELAAIIRKKGFKGKFICPLPAPRIF